MQQAGGLPALQQLPVFKLPPKPPNPAQLPANTGQTGLEPASLNTQLPASADNIGLGAQSVPDSEGNLLSTVAANVTQFLQETFGDGCKLPNCGNIADTFWSGLEDDLTAASQGAADPFMMDTVLSKVNDFWNITQPKGQNSTPPEIVAWIESMTPSPTPDPTFPLITDVNTALNKTQDLFQKVTGFNATAGGFNQVLQDFFGGNASTGGAAASASGAAGG